ncbi:Metallo-dependent phosphatase-like protein [Gilbertella persicaria]|uniref:Metallo-dependent phosphatase-like protein n=1 Tax=Gilbertella persicaria TaxID=101096 RepID=UPI00222045B8|nr:Metallo-dependent phosphatase-like protein [Gilbertella persicaria]KAI8088075.1 Metallo-dependent phosphatase-like protein [Gilbertella persicaria]
MSQEDNAFKILIATDNHLGYLERDPIRGQDSFKAFREILQIAETEKVDFILLGGDLFHHNRPSRSCLYQTMKMIRQHCFGERESKVWIASDQSINFADEFSTANYLDENLNISIPIFSIHGNHDDPSGIGNLCALNLLSVSGMVNYFGASQSIEQVVIQPILMQKGQSKLALYGLGNIREERLHRQWRGGHVKFMRPQDEGWRDCFNLFVFHQNRARHGPTSHIPEEFLDSFIDLVFWGHEHECRIHPEEFQYFAVTQPGSSVATSLSQGEAEPKHVGLLTIEGDSYHLDKIRLKTIRPFQFTTISLSRVENLVPSDAKGIQQYLGGVVENLIEKAKLEWEDQQGEDAPNMEMPMPLIRIRVDYSGGYETFNPQQFGQKFIDRVANPNDILKFQRTRPETQTRLKPSEMIADLTTAIPERLDTLKVEDLVSELLSRDLSILSETGLEEAVKSLVEKSDKEAIRSFVTNSVAQTRESMTVLPEDLTLDYILRKSTEAKQSQDQPSRRNAVRPIQELQGRTENASNSTIFSDDEMSDIMIPSQPSQRRQTATRGRGKGSGTSRIRRQDSDDMNEEPPSISSSTSSLLPTRARRVASEAPSYVISSDEEQEASSGGYKRTASSPSPAPSSLSQSTGKRRRVLPTASLSQKKR